MRVSAFLSALLVLAYAAAAQNTTPKVPAGSFAQVNGSQIYYEECGSGPDAIILMHDGVANSAVFDLVWPMFCNHFHTIRYDRRGYGRSPQTKSPYYEADDLAALITDRKLKHVALAASSHGGQVAMEYAFRYPEFVGHLIVVGPGVTGFPYSQHFIMREITFGQSPKVEDQIEAMIKDRYLLVPTHEAAKTKLRAILTAAPQDLTHNDMPLPEKPTFPTVRQLTMPTLILVGSEDIADNHAVAGALAVTIPNAVRVVIPDAGHLMYLEKPQDFYESVELFLKLHGFPETR